VIHPIKEIAAISEKHGICFFTDATQSFGKVNIDVQTDNIDLMAFSSHKIYGPKGVGGLYIKNRQPSIKLATLMHGGGHENKLRSGTLNVPGIVGFGAAGLLSMDMQKNDQQNYLQLSEAFSMGIEKMNGVYINAAGAERMPNVLNICFDLEGGEGLLKKISKHVAVASGSACSSAIVEPSHVLTAMGLDRKKANSSIRFSFGRTTTIHEIQKTVDLIEEALNI
jgi:cysteine desulfurase